MPLSTFLIAALVSLVSTVIFWAVNGLLLKLIAGWLSFKDKHWGTAFKTAGYAAILSYVLSLVPAYFSAFFLGVGRIAAFALNAVFIVVNAVVFIWLIRKFYYQPWSRSTLAWGIIFIANIIIGFIVGLFMALLATALAFSAVQFA